MATVWKVPNLWPGRSVAVFASGPSMTPTAAAAVRAAGLPALATNNTYRLAPWADVLYAADDAWWQEHPDALGFRRVKVGGGNPPDPRVMVLRNTGAEGYDPDPTCFRTGGNSGYAAVHIAAQAGARRILLLGFDMRGGHWHGPHPKPLRTTPPPTFGRWIERFETLAAELEKRGVQVINCTPGSALKCFARADLVKALEK